VQPPGVSQRQRRPHTVHPLCSQLIFWPTCPPLSFIALSVLGQSVSGQQALHREEWFLWRLFLSGSHWKNLLWLVASHPRDYMDHLSSIGPHHLPPPHYILWSSCLDTSVARGHFAQHSRDATGAKCQEIYPLCTSTGSGVDAEGSSISQFDFCCKKLKSLLFPH
jgi:hypothetical protein